MLLLLLLLPLPLPRLLLLLPLSILYLGGCNFIFLCFLGEKSWVLDQKCSEDDDEASSCDEGTRSDALKTFVE
jgi:hypothetical protein